MSERQQPRYCGRFAPSPSGPLHAGSLVAAVGSYLDAKAHEGKWLVRIEDIDPPREVPGASDIILQQLADHGLHWDDNVSFQRHHQQRYQQIIELLQAHHSSYYCRCTRRQIKARGEHYDGFCRAANHGPEHAAIRFINQQPIEQLVDRRLGILSAAPEHCREDFVLRRRDQLWAYQLAVVADDRAEGISHIVRGEDLATASLWQMTLWQRLDELEQLPSTLPSLLHLPLITDSQGQKLSKQNHAPALDSQQPAVNLWQAYQSLELDPPATLKTASMAASLGWAVEQWQHRWCRSNLPPQNRR